MVACENLNEEIHKVNNEENNKKNEKMAFTGFILSLIGAILMCFTIIPVAGLVIFFIASGFIIVSENMLNKYKTMVSEESRYCKIGKILTVVGAGISIVFLVISICLTLL